MSAVPKTVTSVACRTKSTSQPASKARRRADATLPALDTNQNPGVQGTGVQGTRYLTPLEIRPESDPKCLDTPEPGREPTGEPTTEPGREPTREPGRERGREPGREPTREPGREPGREPTREPSRESGREPTGERGREPGGEPTGEPTPAPTQALPSESARMARGVVEGLRCETVEIRSRIGYAVLGT